MTINNKSDSSNLCVCGLEIQLIKANLLHCSGREECKPHSLQGLQLLSMQPCPLGWLGVSAHVLVLPLGALWVDLVSLLTCWYCPWEPSGLTCCLCSPDGTALGSPLDLFLFWDAANGWWGHLDLCKSKFSGLCSCNTQGPSFAYFLIPVDLLFFFLPAKSHKRRDTHRDLLSIGLFPRWLERPRLG